MAYDGTVFTVISREHYLIQAQLAESHVPMYQMDPVAPPNALINTSLGSVNFHWICILWAQHAAL
jgi:hypothetical protein